MDKIGQGTYSSVYRACDLETGKIVAFKKVRFINSDPENMRFMARVINVLRKLDHPNVMKLEGLVTSRMSDNLYLVFEYMEHDLAGISASPMIELTESQRYEIVNGLTRVEGFSDDNLVHKEKIESIGDKGVPDIWLTTMKSNEVLADELQLVEAEKKKIRQEYERKQKQVEVRKKMLQLQMNLVYIYGDLRMKKAPVAELLGYLHWTWAVRSNPEYEL